MSKFTNLIRRAPKRFSAFVVMAVAAITIPAVVFAWGPSRPTFTIANPANYVTFNSITDNPDYGDERNFVRIKDAANTAAGGWSDEVTVQPGKEYLVQMYVHNNAADNLNLVAKDVNAKFNVPATTGKSVEINGFLTSSNASPTQIWDQAILKSDRDFNVAYVAGSAVYYNNKTGQAGVKLGDSIVTNSGVKLGYELPLNGDIPGCFKYSGYVSFKVKAQVQEVTDFTLQKKVSKHGAAKWEENYKAQPGEKVDFLLAYKNTGEVQHDDVTFRDTLPAGLSYVTGSTTWSNASKQNVKASDNIANGVGVNVGSYAKGANAYVIFTATVAANDALPTCGVNTLLNKGKVNTGGYSVEDTATVTVDKYCKPPVKYTCDNLAIKTLSRTEYRFTTTYTAQNATFKSVTYTVRDAAGKVVDTKTATTNTLNYTQTTAGKYTVQASVTFSVDGTDKTVTSDGCKGEFEVPALPNKITVCELDTKKIITIDEKDFDAKKHSKDLNDCKDIPVVPPITPEVPTELPQTGLTDNSVAVIGLGALIASIAYYVASRRALSL